MKSHKLFVASAAIALLASCNEAYDYPSYNSTPQLRINVVTNSIVTPFEGNFYDSKGFSSGSYLKLNTIVYDEKGDLVEESEIKYSDFNNEARFSFDLKKGKYTVVNIANMYNEDNDIDYWTLSEKSKLQNLSLDTDYQSSYNILSYDKQEIRVGDENKENIIYLKPTTGLVFLRYSNFAAALNKVDTIDAYISRYHNNINITNDSYSNTFVSDIVSYMTRIAPEDYICSSNLTAYRSFLPQKDVTMILFVK